MQLVFSAGPQTNMMVLKQFVDVAISVSRQLQGCTVCTVHMYAVAKLLLQLLLLLLLLLMMMICYVRMCSSSSSSSSSSIGSAAYVHEHEAATVRVVAVG